MRFVLVGVVAVLSQACVTLSRATREKLHVEGAVTFVRAPTPTVTVRVAGKGARLNPELGKGMSFFESPLWRAGRAPRDAEMNVTSRFGGPDPADLLAVATLQEFEAMGFPAPTAMPGLLVRFDDAPARWPATAKAPGELLMHAQVDGIKVDAQGFPLALNASLTLFVGGEVELHTRCAEQTASSEANAEAWMELLRRCVRTLLAPFTVERPRAK